MDIDLKAIIELCLGNQKAFLNDCYQRRFLAYSHEKRPHFSAVGMVICISDFVVKDTQVTALVVV